jgi:hypothetical protein
MRVDRVAVVAVVTALVVALAPGRGGARTPTSPQDLATADLAGLRAKLGMMCLPANVQQYLIKKATGPASVQGVGRFVRLAARYDVLNVVEIGSDILQLLLVDTAVAPADVSDPTAALNGLYDTVRVRAPPAVRASLLARVTKVLAALGNNDRTNELRELGKLVQKATLYVAKKQLTGAQASLIVASAVSIMAYVDAGALMAGFRGRLRTGDETGAWGLIHTASRDALRVGWAAMTPAERAHTLDKQISADLRLDRYDPDWRQYLMHRTAVQPDDYVTVELDCDGRWRLDGF